MVHGTVKGAYTIVTDYVFEYRRHDNPNIVDQIWVTSGSLMISGMKIPIQVHLI